MSRIVLFHWNTAEAAERVGQLRRAGHEVSRHLAEGGASSLRTLADRPPDAFVIDLSRLPSRGRAVATALRQRQGTRAVPIVFVEGDPEKRARLREALPDAVYTTWARVRGDLRRAIASPPREPVVPGTMDGYSGTPLPRKLGIRSGTKVALLGAPRGFEQRLRPLPEGAAVVARLRPGVALVLLFVGSRAALERRFPAAARGLVEAGSIWILWPKQASGVRTDLTQAVVRAYGLGSGFVDYKICAVDEIWSGLLFCRRRPKGPGQA